VAATVHPFHLCLHCILCNAVSQRQTHGVQKHDVKHQRRRKHGHRASLPLIKQRVKRQQKCSQLLQSASTRNVGRPGCSTAGILIAGMPAAKRSGKHLLLPELKKWYDTLPSITWNDFNTAQDVRAFLAPPGSDKSGYGPMPTDLSRVRFWQQWARCKLTSFADTCTTMNTSNHSLACPAVVSI